MKLELLARKALDKLKSEYKLPETGFLAGGSLANTVWELVSGKKAVINDIDIFILESVVENAEHIETLYTFNSRKKVFSEEYNGELVENLISKDFYSIVNAERIGPLNIIKYVSNRSNQDFIIETFDINSTQIGYSFDLDKFYWTSQFEEFLTTGNLQVSNMSTPSHTALRIIKKRDELGAKLDNLEFKILQFGLSRLTDIKFRRFREKYHETWKKYEKELSEYFFIQNDEESENWVLLTFNETVKLFYLRPEEKWLENYKKGSNILKIHNSMDLIFYMRKIYGNQKLENLWEKLYFFFNNDDYIDCDADEKDIDLISKLARNAPQTIKNLSGLKLSQQISLVNKIFDKFTEEPLIAISILEKHNIADIELTEENLLLLELTVRKKILNDKNQKVSKIFGLPVETNNDEIDSLPF